MLRGALACLLFSLGCVDASAVHCADGRVCPGGTVCDNVHALCVTRAQKTACKDLIDADRCTAGDFEGICDQSVCIAGCGDGVQDGEECDDGNLASHDGCSSACQLEVPTWDKWQSQWTPRSQHATAYMIAQQKLVVFGGTDDLGPTDQQWEGSGFPNLSWKPVSIPRPTARESAMMAYDEQNDRIVLFGGTASSTGDLASGLSDTWTYNGTAWTQVQTTTAPPARFGGCMAYAGSGRVVLFGGIGTAGPLDDTWELSGSTWTEIGKNIPNPAARRFCAMAWAPFSGSTPDQVVMTGGLGTGGALQDMWKYTSGAGWSVVAILTAKPQARYGHMMAYSSTRDAVVLFGGGTSVDSFGDTWEYNPSSAWTAIVDPGTPAARSQATLTTIGPGVMLIGGAAGSGAFDDAWAYGAAWTAGISPGVARARGEAELVYAGDDRQTYVLGGFRESPTPAQADTFAFNGSRWTRDQNLNKARYRFASAYDSVRKRIVVFGGLNDLAAPLDDTELHGAAGWNVLGPAQMQPPRRAGGAMAFAASQQQIVLFGGRGTATVLGDTWTFDGQSWSQRQITGPAASERPAMAYDPVNDRVVVFDEAGATWALTTTGWSQVAAGATPPPARSAAAMAYSPELRRVVLYGGTRTTNGATEILTDLWQLTETGWEAIVPVGPTPPARSDPRIVDHAEARELLLHAGTAATGRPLNDTWLFQFRSDTPDEVCMDGSDNDGDKRVDLDDPDCLR